jgi:hypothetical protein
MADVSDNLVGVDPQFVAPEKSDFRLRRTSPAWKTGFVPIPMEKIGLYEDAARGELKNAIRIITRH